MCEMIKPCSLNEYYDACGDLRVDFDGDQDVIVEHITNDSREVRPGSLFVAIKGTKADGRDYIPQAIYNGAVGVVYMQDQSFKLSVPSFRVRDDYAALGRIAAFHYGYPGTGMTTIGITGTNGKTTTAFLLRSIFNNFDIKTGFLGSVYYDTGDKITKSPYDDTGTPQTSETSLRNEKNRCSISDNGSFKPCFNPKTPWKFVFRRWYIHKSHS